MKTLKSKNNFSKPQLIVFLIVFASIGYLIFRSFAAGTLGSALPARMPLSTGSGGTYYVDGTAGSDSSSGSSAAPWKTINHALNTVPLSGSIIRVRPGTYYSSSGSYVIQFTRSGNISNPVTLMADKPGTVTIANGNLATSTFGAWILNASGLRIQDFTFRILSNAGIDGFDGEVLVENSDKVELYHNTFNEVGVIAITCRGGHLTTGDTADDMWVLDNTFRPSGANPYAQVTGLSYTNQEYFGTKGSHWIYAGQYGQDPTDGNWNYTNGCRRMVVANNIFTGVAAGRDIEFGPQEQNSYIVNNTFFGNQSVPTIGMGAGPGSDACPCYAGQGVVLYSNTSTAAYQTGNNVVTNNIFADMYGHAGSGSGPAESGNLFQNNLSYKLTNGGGYDGSTSVDYYPTANPLLSTGTGNLPDADPLFNNPLGYDFNLKAGSPAIGKADPAYTFPQDINGNQRSATAPSLGAIEPTGTVAPAPSVSLSASPTSITAGQSSTLSWSSSNASSCSAAWTSSTATSGSQMVSPSSTTSYTVTCTGSGGSASANASVTVTAAISNFTTNITVGMTINPPFTWTFNPGVASVTGYFYADGVKLNTVSGPPPYTYILQPGALTPGAHVLGGSWDMADGTHTTFPNSYNVTVASTAKPGDVNNDGLVNITDLSILLSDYGTTNASADLNKDGTVNILDMSILLSNYGT